MSIDPVYGGGTAERTVQISRALSNAGISCEILTTAIPSQNSQPSGLDGVNLVALDCIYKRYLIPKLSTRIISDAVSKADIVHLMNHWTVINALVYIFARQQNKPYVVCPAGSLPLFGRSKKLKKLYNCVIGQRIISKASGHIAISKNEIPHFESYGVSRDKIQIIPNGIDPAEFDKKSIRHFREKFGLGYAPFLLFVGRLNFIKGPDLLIAAFKKIKNKYSDYHLVFSGPDGGMLETLKKKAQVYNLSDCIHFTGYIEGSEKSSAYHAANLLVIPSRQEAMSIVVLEAGITGTPVLLTDKCGFNEVADIRGGKVVSATEKGLCNGIDDILKNSRKLLDMGCNLKKFVETHYTWNKMIKKYLDMYNRILPQKVL
jgi:glycosyltransferase involved in cell wall biosynthesis